ncbi:hypothetical protein A2U01_0036003, partial [Trifolium medium]|nr:hypothetical protein [Trifolium medium]
MEDVYSLLINSFKEQKSISSALDWFSALWKARRLNHPLCCSPISESFIPHLSEQLHQRSSTLFKDASDERYFVEKLSKDEASTFGLAYAHLERSRQEASTGDVDEALMQALKSHEHFSKIVSETQEITFKGVEACLVENREIDFKEN